MEILKFFKMENKFHSNVYIDKYILRDLTADELEEFRNMINIDSVLSTKVEDRESDLIKMYLRKELSQEFGKKLEGRIITDKEFKERLIFIKGLIIASKEIKKKNEIREQLGEIKKKVEQEKANGTYIPVSRKNGRTITLKYWLYAVPAAAAVAILLLIIPPQVERIKINRYLADSNIVQHFETSMIQIDESGGRTFDSTKYIASSGLLNIYVLKNDPLKDKYFIKDKVLYTYGDSQEKFKVLTRINTEGQAEYFLCKRDGIYSFSINKENSILRFEIVTDSTILKYCQ